MDLGGGGGGADRHKGISCTIIQLQHLFREERKEGILPGVAPPAPTRLLRELSAGPWLSSSTLRMSSLNRAVRESVRFKPAV